MHDGAETDTHGVVRKFVWGNFCEIRIVCVCQKTYDAKRWVFQ